MGLENQISYIEKQINEISSSKQVEINKLQKELDIHREKLNLIKDLQNKIKYIDEKAIPLIKEETKWSVWDKSLTHRKYNRWGDFSDSRGNAYDEYNGGWCDIQASVGVIDVDLKVEMLEKQKGRYIVELNNLISK